MVLFASHIKEMFFRHPVKVVILEKRGNGYAWDFDKARKSRDERGREKYVLKKRKHYFTPPKYSDIHLTVGGKNVLPVMSLERGVYLPIKVENPKGIKVMDKGAEEFIVNQFLSSEQRFPTHLGFFEKYSGYILLGLTGVMMIFIVLFMSESFSRVAGSLASTGDSLARAAEALKPLANAVNRVSQTPLP